MRFSTAFVALLSASVASARGLGLWGADQAVVANDGLKIPGESPLELCSKDRDDDIISIERVDLLPNPPKAGQSLVINAVGTVRETIEDGAYINLSVKYGLIRLINTKVDLCDQIKNVDLDCPIENGQMTVTKAVDLPDRIPPGKYTVFADVFTKDDVPITCLTATVEFKLNGADSVSLFDLEL